MTMPLLDGDGDRVIFIDKGGEVYNGDKLLYVLANFLNSLAS